MSGAAQSAVAAGIVAAAHVDERRALEIIENLMDAIEQQDQGLRLAIDTIVALERRVAALEKCQPKPVILNSVGGRAN